MSFILRIVILFLFFGSSLLFASIGRVSLLKGEASLDRAGAVFSVQNGMDLEEKDSIKTTKGSQIQLIFSDKTVITLGSESHFSVDEYLSDGSNPKAKFKFNQGAFKAITGKIGKSAPENFTLETKTATIGIRGTIVGGNVPPQSSSEPDTIICLGGSITATSLQSGVTVNLPAGTITVVPISGPPAPPRQATPQDIAQFNQSLGTPPPPESSEDSSSSQDGSNSSSQSENDSSTEQSEDDETQTSSDSTTSSGSTSSSNSEISDSMANEAPPQAPASTTSPATQTTTPAAATTAEQTNQLDRTQDDTVENIAQGAGVSTEQVQQHVATNNPNITPPPPADPTPPDPDPTPPDPIDPTPPPADPTPPNPDPVDPTPPPADPTPPPSGGGGNYTPPTDPPPSQPSQYTTLFSNMSASDGTSVEVLFPGETTSQVMVFNAQSSIWISQNGNYSVSISSDEEAKNYLLQNNTKLYTETKIYVKTPAQYLLNNTYASWGYWVLATDYLTNEPKNYWISGNETTSTAISSIIENTEYSYSGNVLGYLGGILILLDEDNSFKANIIFGSTNPIEITEMKFNTIDSQAVFVADLADQVNTISENGFSGETKNVNFEGKFYGSEANNIGGTWSGTFGSDNGSGVFKAVKIEEREFTFETLFDDMVSIENETTAEIVFPGESTPQTIIFDKEMSAWKTGNDSYIVLESTNADLEVYLMLSDSKIYVKDETYTYTSDYSSWGYWTMGAELAKDRYPNFWIVGAETNPSVIANIIENTTYSYSGNVLGQIENEGTTYSILQDPTNSFKANIKFGEQNPITITEMKFYTTMDSNLVDVMATQTLVSSSIDGNTFNTFYEKQIDQKNIELQGNFFGPNAEQIGGTWNGKLGGDEASPIIGHGVFKAVIEP